MRVQKLASHGGVVLVVSERLNALLWLEPSTNAGLSSSVGRSNILTNTTTSYNALVLANDAARAHNTGFTSEGSILSVLVLLSNDLALVALATVLLSLVQATSADSASSASQCGILSQSSVLSLLSGHSLLPGRVEWDATSRIVLLRDPLALALCR